MCTVIHYLARTCHSTCLKEIYTKAVSAVNTMLRAYSIAVEVLDAALRNVILWETGNKFRFDTIVCKRHCNVGLAATESSLKLFCLRESQITRSCKAEHDLTECNYFWHDYMVFKCFSNHTNL